MSVFLGSNQIGCINLLQLQNINTDLENSLIDKSISLYSNNEIFAIRSYAFAYCTNLTSINFPNCTYIGISAFRACSNLISISFPSCISIGAYAFAYCTNLISVDFPNCTSIETSAFLYCSNLASINFSNCTSIGDFAFYSCNNLTTISFPNCNYIGEYAFTSCKSLTEANFPNCTSLNFRGFFSCENLASIYFPKCTFISGGAFAGCALTSVNLSSCTFLSNFAFGKCTHLSIVSLPNCSFISDMVFKSCYNLLSLYLLGSSVPGLLSIDTFNLTPIGGYTTSTGGVYGSIYVPASLYNSYITTTNWSVYSARIVSTNIVYSGSYEVYHVSYIANNVNHVNIPNVTTISPDVLYIEINGIKYDCSKQDVSSDYGYSAYAYGYYGTTNQWGSDDYPFSLVFSNSDETLAILSSVAEAGDSISLTVFYI